MSTYPFAMNCSLFIGGILYTLYGQKANYASILVATFIAQAIIMIMIPFSADIGGSSAYWLCFALLFFFGLFSGVNNALCYSYNAKLPSSYIAVFLTSHGAAGIFSNLLRLISLNIWPISSANLTGASGLDDTDSAFKQCLFIQTVGVFIVLLCLPA